MSEDLNNDANNYAIDVKGISKSFDHKKVVNNVSLKVKKGEIFGFLGPNGSGKTTTIRMICGLLTPDEGEGTCLGFDIRKDAQKIKNKVGYMTQKFSLYSDLTVRENLEFIARLYSMDRRKERINQAIERLGIGQARAKQLAGQLSGGWKQRLALACAILHEPELLLLDEPTAGVDPKARREFWEHIFDLSQEGITTLVSTHYMDEAERCHHLAYLAYGNLLTFGTNQEVVESAKLQTWEISGNQIEALNILAKRLKNLPEITQISAFGTKLHISGLRDSLVGSAPCGRPGEGGAFEILIRKNISPGFSIKQISPSLEDVFIHYMQTQKDNFA